MSKILDRPRKKVVCFEEAYKCYKKGRSIWSFSSQKEYKYMYVEGVGWRDHVLVDGEYKLLDAEEDGFTFEEMEFDWYLGGF